MPNPKDSREKLYNLMVEMDLFDGEVTFEQFTEEHKTKAGQQRLYDYVKQAEVYSKDYGSFSAQFFGDFNQERVDEKKKAIKESVVGGTDSKKDLQDGSQEEVGGEEVVEEEPPNPEKTANSLLNNPYPTPEGIVSIDDVDPNTLTLPWLEQENRVVDDANATLKKLDRKAEVIQERKDAGDLSEEKYDKMIQKLQKDRDKQRKIIAKENAMIQDINPQVNQQMLDAKNNIYSLAMQTTGDLEDPASGIFGDAPLKSAAESKEKQKRKDALFERAKMELGWNDEQQLESMMKIEEAVMAGEVKQAGKQVTVKQYADAKSQRMNTVLKGILDEQDDLNDKEKAALQTYLAQRLQKYPATVKAEQKFKQTLDKLGFPSEKEMEEEKAALEKMNDDLSKGVAVYKTGFEQQGKLLDGEYSKTAKAYQDQRKEELDIIYEELQKAVNEGMDPEEANKQLNAFQQETNATLEKYYDDYMGKRSRVMSQYVKEFGGLEDLQAKIDEKAEAFKKKYADTYGDPERMGLIMESIFDEADIEHKAKLNKRWEQLSLGEKLGTSLIQGMDNLVEGVFGGVKYFAPNAQIADLNLSAIDIRRELRATPELAPTTLASTLDPDWWIKNAGEQLPIMLPLMGVGGGAMRLGTGMLGRATSLSLKSRQAFASVFGGATSRVFEGGFEAYTGYTNALKNGKSYEEAVEDFNQIYKMNMALIATDALQTYFTFAKGSKVVANRYTGSMPQTLRNVTNFAGKSFVEVFTEGYEEGWQEYAQAKRDNPFLTFGDFMNSEAGKEIFWMGGIMGAGMGRGMEFMQNGGLGDRSAIGTLNRQIQDYYKQFDFKDLNMGDIDNRLHQLKGTIDLLEDRGVLTDKEIGDARQKLGHVRNMYKQSYDGLLPFAPDTKQFETYAGLVYEHDQVQREMEEIDQKVPNQQQMAEKRVLEERAKNLDSEINKLLNDEGSYTYEFNETPMTQTEFESLVFDRNNRRAVQEGIAVTDNPQILKRMRDEGIAEDQTIANAEVFAENAKSQRTGEPLSKIEQEGLTVQDIDDAIILAEQQYEDAKENTKRSENTSGFMAALHDERQAEKTVLDLIHYKSKVLGDFGYFTDENVPNAEKQIRAVMLAETGAPMDKVRVQKIEEKDVDRAIERTESNIKEYQGILEKEKGSENEQVITESIAQYEEDLADLKAYKEENFPIETETTVTEEVGGEVVNEEVVTEETTLETEPVETTEEVVEVSPTEEGVVPTEEVVETTETTTPTEDVVTEEIAKGEPTDEVDTKVSPTEDRKRGYRVKGGQKYSRQESPKTEVGSTTEVFFSPEESVEAEFVLMEADDVQPSHYKGEKNPQHFIDEAQPKDRSKKELKYEGVKKAKDLKPGLITEGASAFQGAPTVNERGENIQGNGRSEGIKIAYAEYPQNAAKYKQHLKDNAAKYGLTPEQVDAMEQPMLVRKIKADDAEAIRLGQFSDERMVDVGGKDTEAKQRVRGLKPEQIAKITRFLDVLRDDTSTLNSAINDGGINLMKVLRDEGVISQQEFVAGTKLGSPSADLVNKVENAFEQLALEGSDMDLRGVYDDMPKSFRDRFKRAIIPMLKSTQGKSLLPDMQQAIIAARQFLLAKNKKDVKSFEEWSSPTQQTLGGEAFGFAASPSEVYTPVELALAELFLSKKKPVEIAQIIADYNNLTTDQSLTDIFAPKPISKIAAINELLGTNIKEDELREGTTETDQVGTETESQQEQDIPETTKEGSKEIEQPQTVVEELPSIEDEASAEGETVDMSNVGIDNAVDYYDGQIKDGVDPSVAKDMTLDFLKASPMMENEIAEVEKMLDERVKLDNVKKGISHKATEIGEKVKEDLDAKEVEALAEENDQLLEEAELPQELDEDLLKALYDAGIIDEMTHTYAVMSLKDPDNDLLKQFYEVAKAELPNLVEGAKTSKKETKKPKNKKVSSKKKSNKKKDGKKRTKPKPKSVKQKKVEINKNFNEALQEMEDLLRGFDTDSGTQATGKVKPIDIIKAGIKLGYYGIDKLAEQHKNDPDKINKTEWKKMLDGALGSTNAAIVQRYYDQIWDLSIIASIDPATPTISEHAANARKKAKAAKAKEGVDPKAKPETKQSKPKVKDTKKAKASGKRPPLVYTNHNKLPAKVDEYVVEGEYGSDLDQDQRYAVNMALTNFLTNNQKGFLLNDSMGVGKTRQMLATAKAMADKTGKPILIVTKNKTIIDDAFKSDAAAMGIDLNASGIKITTYTQLAKEVGNSYGLVIYDEAHSLKNPNKAYEASGNISSPYVMHSTATPGDKVANGVYFLSDILGVSRETMMGELGVQVNKDGQWEMMPGRKESEALETIRDYIQKAYEDGKVIRREYPFWGRVTESTMPLDSVQEEEINNVRMAYDKEIDSVRPGTYFDGAKGEYVRTSGRRSWDKRYNGLSESQKEALDDEIMRSLREQKIQALDKLVETYKADSLVKLVANDLAQGKSVVIASKNVNELTIRGLDKDYKSKQKRESFLAKIKDALKAKGIEFSEITGNVNNKEEEIRKFQEGEVQVVIGSLASMSTGINLDDTLGGAPRKLYVSDASYDANEFDQIKGRVSRRNTQSPSEAVVLYGNTASEDIKRGKVGKKTGVLGVFQGGEIDTNTMETLQRADSFREKKPEKKKPAVIEDLKSGRAFVVKDSYPIKGILKSLGAKWNNSAKAWMFPIGRKAEIQAIVDKYNAEGDIDVDMAQTARGNYMMSSMGTGAYGKTELNAMNKSTGSALVDRIPPAPIPTSNEKIPKQKMFRKLRAATKFIAKYGRVRGKQTLGTYNPYNSLIKLRRVNDFDTFAHELGHYLHDKFNVINSDSSIFDEDLAKYWGHGSAPPTEYAVGSTKYMQYQRREGVAELIRALIMNPVATRAQSPELVDAIWNKLLPDVQQSITDFSQDLRKMYGMDAVTMGKQTQKSNILDQEARDGFIGTAKKRWASMMERHGFNNAKGSDWYMSWADRFETKMIDGLLPARKAYEQLQKLQGWREILPKNDFRILGRVFAGLGGKVENMLNRGLVVKDPSGKMERVVDPVTGQRITVDWLLQPISETINKNLLDTPKLREKAAKMFNAVYRLANPNTQKRFKANNLAIRDFKDYVSVYMTAERTKEYAERLGREEDLTGLSINNLAKSDLQVANEILEMHEKLGDEIKAQVKEAARRYRAFADATLQYMVSGGRISQEMYNNIKDNNEYYVDLHRSMEAEPGEEFAWMEAKSKGEMTMAKIKGGSQDRIDPYQGLIENFYKSIEETDRNEVLNSFFDMAKRRKGEVSLRKFEEGQITPIGELMRPVFQKPEGKLPDNVIRVYNDGVAEHWEVHKDIKGALDHLLKAKQFQMPGILKLHAQFVRLTVTKNPIFAYIRNLPRDLQARVVQSRTMGKALSMKKYEQAMQDMGMDPVEIKEEINKLNKKGGDWNDLFQLYGADQAGHYTKSEKHYYAALDISMRKAAANGDFILDPRAISIAWQNYDKWLAKGEKFNRVAEYKSAFKYAKTQLKYDDYDASLYAAQQSRDLMDFATIGETMKYINQMIPFANASVQGTARLVRGLTESPAAAGRTLARWSMFNLGPALGFYALAHMMGYEDEYEELPAYQRDMYYNFKIPGLSDNWIRIPKSFELGVMSTGVERMIQAAKTGDFTQATRGWGGSVASVMMPFKMTDGAGFLKPVIESYANYDFFRGRSIVPVWEEDQAVIARKGFQKRQGSNMGHLIYNMMDMMPGMQGADPRKIDHVIRSWFTYWGSTGIKMSNLVPRGSMAYFRDQDDQVLQDTDIRNQYENSMDGYLSVLGLVAKSHPSRAETVKFLKQQIEDLDLRSTPDAKMLYAKLKSWDEAPENLKDKKMDEILDYAQALEKTWRPNIKKYKKVLKGGTIKEKGTVMNPNTYKMETGDVEYNVGNLKSLRNKLFNN